MTWFPLQPSRRADSRSGGGGGGGGSGGGQEQANPAPPGAQRGNGLLAAHPVAARAARRVLTPSTQLGDLTPTHSPGRPLWPGPRVLGTCRPRPAASAPACPRCRRSPTSRSPPCPPPRALPGVLALSWVWWPRAHPPDCRRAEVRVWASFLQLEKRKEWNGGE